VSGSVSASAFQYFDDVDARFSPYKLDSELSAMNRGEIAPEAISPPMQERPRSCPADSAIETMASQQGKTEDLLHRRADRVRARSRHGSSPTVRCPTYMG